MKIQWLTTVWLHPCVSFLHSLQVQVHQKRTKDQIQGCTEAGDQTQTPILPREDDIVSQTFLVSLSLSQFFSIYHAFLYLSSSACFLHLIFLILCILFLNFSRSCFSSSSSPSSFCPPVLFSVYLPACTTNKLYSCLLDTQIYSCNCATTVLQNTIKISGSFTGIIKTFSRPCLKHLGGFTVWWWSDDLITPHSQEVRMIYQLERLGVKRHSFPELSSTFYLTVWWEIKLYFHTFDNKLKHYCCIIIHSNILCVTP